MRKKLLPVLVGVLMIPIISSASEVKVSDDAKPIQTKAATDATAKAGDAGVKTLTAQQSTRKILTQPFMPTARQGSWRFGLWRNKHSGYYHTGLDFSGKGNGGDGVVFSDSGTLLQNGGSYNKVEFMRDNKDKIMMLHADTTSKGKVGSRVVGGNRALIMGQRDGANNNTYGKHLHYEYHVLSNSGRQRYIGVGGVIPFTTRTKQKGVSFHTNTMGSSNNFSGRGYVVTDPTPYLPNDFIFNGTDYDARLEQYLGNSARTQYNALYRPNPLLPVGSGVKRPTKQFVNLPAPLDNLSPEEIAAMSGGAVNASLYADGAGYDLNGQLMSQQMVASFISADDGSDWGALPQTPAANLTEQTPQEIITKIAFQRFGNPEWEKAMITLSSKGLLTEYALMNAEENFLRQQNQRMKNRIELQLASLNQAQLFEYNKKIEAMNILATAEAVPKMIDKELEQLPSGFYQNTSSSAQMDNFDMSNLPSDLDGLLESLMTAISHKEGPSHDAWNNGTACGKAGRSNPNGGGRWKPTSMTPVQIIQTYRPTYRLGQTVPKGAQQSCDSFIFASGFIQTVPWTLAGIIKANPQYANVPYTPENQRILAKTGLLLNTWRDPLKNFLRNGGNDAQLRAAMYAMSMEWASIGVPSGERRENGTTAVGDYTTYYGKGNAANEDSTRMVMTVLKKIQMYHQNSGA